MVTDNIYIDRQETGRQTETTRDRKTDQTIRKTDEQVDRYIDRQTKLR